MYAIIEFKGKQYKVNLNTRLLIELISGAQVGDRIVLNNVLMIGGSRYDIGVPFVFGARVYATVVNMGIDSKGVRKKKIRVFKKKRRKGYHKMIGHRQRYTEIEVNEIKFSNTE